MKYAVKLNAGNDTNGNPRRGWLIFSASGVTLGWVEEGYSGSGALRARRLIEGKSVILLLETMVPLASVREARRMPYA